MPKIRIAPRPASAGLVAIVVVLAACGGERAAGQLPDVAIPTDRDLLRDPPFDRLTLIDGTVLFVDPVSPRPLPDKEAIRKAEREAAKAPEFENVGGLLVRRAPELNRGESDNAIVIRTQEAEPADYYVKITSIGRADYFEDILLAEALRRAKSGDFARAFELVLAVQARAPSWRGLRETADRIALLEGQDALTKGRVDEGLRLLGELHARTPDFPGLAPLLAEGYTGRIQSAIGQGAFALGRRVLGELRTLAPESDAIGRMETRFIDRAKALAREAEGLVGPDRTERLAAALRVWPADEEIAEAFRQAFVEAPVLDVGVLDVPLRPGPFVECAADDRVIRLLYLPIMADTSEQATRGERDGQLAAELTVGDIGRRLTIRVKDGLSWDDGSRPIGAVDLARALSDRALPSTIGFDARWSDLLSRVTLLGDREVEVVLRRAPLDPSAWLLMPVGPAHGGRDGLVWTPDGPRPIGSGPFTLGPLTRGGATLERSEGAAGGTIPIARVRERRIDPPDDPVSALRRGDVALIESAPPDRLAELAADPEIKVGRYKAPRMHWLAIDGRNPMLRNRSLRRALSFAVDRQTLLAERVLRRPPDETSAPADGPFPVGSFANDTEVAPLAHDPLLAKMMVKAAKQEMEADSIALTFAYPSIPAARAVVPRLVDAFTEAGLTITAVERPPSELESELRRGARFDLAYRAARIDDPIRDVGPALCPGYAAPTSADGLGSLASARMLQLLLRLEQVQDLPTARELVIAIDREARDELPIVPLWQLQEHYAWRTRLTGPAEEADDLYEGIESWTIEPWFARDEP